MFGTDWLLIDTETNGLAPPVHAIEIAAQRMRGWDRHGPPFRVLLNHGVDIAPAAMRLHGYTPDMLERDGEDPHAAHGALRAYADGLPISSYNLAFDLDQVLLPEWQQLGVEPIGPRGVCLYRLAQRLLDPVPAANCKLQTLRAYYGLPERQAHSALGDVDTTIDLLQRVLRPLADANGLNDWTALCCFAAGEWFPSRLTFGKYKGRDVHDALHDPELRRWLEWLASSSNERSSSMGRWYLDRLNRAAGRNDEGPTPFSTNKAAYSNTSSARQLGAAAGLVAFVDWDTEALRERIGFARGRLAEVEAEYMAAKALADAISADLFRLVGAHYRRRDTLRLIVEYRRKFLDTLLAQGEEQAEEVVDEFAGAKRASDNAHEEAAQAAHTKSDLNDEQKTEIRALWKKLVRLFHPDRYAANPDMQVVYERLTGVINHARDTGAIALLKQIAEDPNGYVARQGWIGLGIDRPDDAEDLRRLYDSIEIAIVDRLEALRLLRESSGYELAMRCQAVPELLSRVAVEQRCALEVEIEWLEAEAERLDREIEELTCRRSRVRM